jgi:multidrug efflux system membrane fusion protein
MRRGLWWRSAALALIVALGAACSGPKEQAAWSEGKGGKGGRGEGRPPTPVVAVAAVAKDVPVELSAIGTVEPNISVQVKAQVGGVLQAVTFKEGADVKKGDLLFRIDPKPYETAVAGAQADLAKARAQAQNARRTNARFEQLARQNVVSREEYDQARANVEALEAAVQSAQAALERSKILLGYTEIRSPIDGRTGDLKVDEGNLIKADDSTALVTINQVAPVMVRFAVPEKDLPEIKQHQAAGDLRLEAAVPNEGGAPARGDLTFINNTVDRATGTIDLKGTFANGDHRLWPGQFVDVRLTLAVQRGAVVVPAVAVQMGQSGPYVYVVQADQTVAVRPVTPGITRAGETALDQGLRAGELVVTDGVARLAPGSKVKVQSAK